MWGHELGVVGVDPGFDDTGPAQPVAVQPLEDSRRRSLCVTLRAVVSLLHRAGIDA